MKARFLLHIGVMVAVSLLAIQAAAAQSGWPANQDPVPQVNPLPNYGPAQYPQQSSQPQYGQQPNGRKGYPQQLTPYPQQNQGYPQQDYGQAPEYGAQAQPLGAEQLEQIVAPIALYPDTLVAQILTAATYPAQVSAAAQWVQSIPGASPDQIAAGASAQTEWDPSVKAMTAYPQVLEWLAGNLQWATALGNAYYNQPQDVLDTIQVMRQRAEQAGNLQSTTQEQVTQDPGYIAIAPASPEVVYVPTYDPWAVYGEPVPAYPGFSFFDGVGSYFGGGVQFGLGFGVGAFLRMPFGLMAWGMDWMGDAILFDHGDYWTHSREMRDWGFEHGGPRWGGRFGDRGRFGGDGRFGGRFAQNYHHQPLAVHGGGGRNFAGRGGFGGRGYGGGNTFGGHGQGYGRTPSAGRPQAFGRPQPYGGRPQSYGGWGGARQVAQNGGGARGFRGPTTPAPGMGFTGRGGAGYGGPQTFRGGGSRPFGGGNSFGGRSGGYARGYSGGYGNSFGRAPKSGGSQWFGGGRSSSGFGGGSSRGFGGGHSYGGGHSFGGGGHSFGGGGHSFGGGGHSFGGGHGGGGHSGGHGGGGHHR